MLLVRTVLTDGGVPPAAAVLLLHGQRCLASCEQIALLSLLHEERPCRVGSVVVPLLRPPWHTYHQLTIAWLQHQPQRFARRISRVDQTARAQQGNQDIADEQGQINAGLWGRPGCQRMIVCLSWLEPRLVLCRCRLGCPVVVGIRACNQRRTVMRDMVQQCFKPGVKI